MLPAIEGVAADEGNARLTELAAGLQKTLGRTNQPAVAYPSPAALGERNLELQQLLAELQEILHENPSGKSRKRLEIATTMRALLRRMLARELEISSPPR
jgi:type VI protein secretion system component VasK